MLTQCGEAAIVTFSYTTEKSKEGKKRDGFIEILLVMQLFLMKKENWRLTNYLYIVCEFYHLKIMGTVYRDKGNLKCQERTDRIPTEEDRGRNNSDDIW